MRIKRKELFEFLFAFLVGFCIVTPIFQRNPLEDIKDITEKQNLLVARADNGTTGGIINNDTNSVIWENQYGRLEVWPHTATELSNHVQYGNITWYYPNNTIDLAFRFDKPLVGDKGVWLWRNISHDVDIPEYGNATEWYFLHDITNYTILTETPETLDFGDKTSLHYVSANATIYRLEGPDTRTYYIGFDNYTWLNPNQTEARFNWSEWKVLNYHKEQQYWFDWDNMNSQFNYIEYQNKSYYYITNVPVIENESYLIKWEYSTEANTNGKWELMGKLSSDTIQEALDSGRYVMLDPWWSSMWAYRRLIVVNDYFVEGSHTGFPILVNITSTDLANKALANGSDIAFVNWSNNNTQYKHEIEYYKPSTGTLVAWVNVSYLDGGDPTNIWMYYGNSHASPQQDKFGTWNQDFEAVYHMNGGSNSTNASSGTLDSTINNHNITTYTGALNYNVSGMAGNSTYLGGGYLEYFNAIRSIFPSTIEVWAKPTVFNGGNYILSTGGEAGLGGFTIDFDGATGFFYSVLANDTGNTMSQIGGGVAGGINHWSYLWGKGDGIDASTHSFSLNKSLVYDLSEAGAVGTASNFHIGCTQGHIWPFTGYLDEIRISKSNRSESWMNTTYNTIRYPASFIKLEGEQYMLDTNVTKVLGNPIAEGESADLGQYGAYGTAFLCNITGPLESISAYVQVGVAAIGNGIKCALYDYTTGALIRETEQRAIPGSGIQWIVCNFSEPYPMVEAQTTYTLAIDTNASNATVYLYHATDTDFWSARDTLTNAIYFADPWASDNTYGRRFSIYGTYNESNHYEWMDWSTSGVSAVYGVGWDAQTFTIGTNGTNEPFVVTNVSIRGYRTLWPGNTTVSIRSTLYGKPTGGDLCSGSLNMSVSGSSTWYNFSMFPACTLNRSTKYAIVFRVPNGDASNYMNMRAASGTMANYTGGWAMSSSDSGATWTNDTSTDWYFHVFGYNNESTVYAWTNVSGWNGTLHNDSHMFGNNTIAYSTMDYFSLSSQILSGKWKMTSDTSQQADAIEAYVDVVSGGDRWAKAMLYDYNGNLIGTTDNVSISQGLSAGWTLFPFTIKPELVANAWYNVSVWMNGTGSGTARLYANGSGANGIGYYTIGNFSDDWAPNPITLGIADSNGAAHINCIYSQGKIWTNTTAWNGTLYNASRWINLTAWNGTLWNLSHWINRTAWNGTIWNGSHWVSQAIWNGTLYNTSHWFNRTAWNGTLYNVSRWINRTAWNGTLWNFSHWVSVKVWNGTLFNSSHWFSIRSWNGTLYNVSRWIIRTTWNGTVWNLSHWVIRTSWNGTIWNLSRWKQPNSTYANSTRWNGTVFNDTDPYTYVDFWNGTVWNQSHWLDKNPHWNGTLWNQSHWKNMTLSWNGTVHNQTHGGTYNFTILFENETNGINFPVNLTMNNSGIHRLIVYYADETEEVWFNNVGGHPTHFYSTKTCGAAYNTSGIFNITVYKDVVAFEFRWNNSEGRTYRCSRTVLETTWNVTIYIRTDLPVYGESTWTFNNSIVRYHLTFLDETFLYSMSNHPYAFLYKYNSSGVREVIHSEYFDISGYVHPWLVFGDSYFIGVGCDVDYKDRIDTVTASTETTQTDLHIPYTVIVSYSFYDLITIRNGRSPTSFYVNYTDTTGSTDWAEFTVYYLLNGTCIDASVQNVSYYDNYNFTFTTAMGYQLYENYSYNINISLTDDVSADFEGIYRTGLIPMFAPFNHSGISNASIDDLFILLFGGSPIYSYDQQDKGIEVPWTYLILFIVSLFLLLSFGKLNAFIGGIAVGFWLLGAGTLISGLSLLYEQRGIFSQGISLFVIATFIVVLSIVGLLGRVEK